MSEYPININTASLEELKLIHGIGDARAPIIIELRKKKKAPLTLEDVKLASNLPSTLWDPLIEKGEITFEIEEQASETTRPRVEVLEEELVRVTRAMEDMKRGYNDTIKQIEEKYKIQRRDFDQQMRQVILEKEFLEVELKRSLTLGAGNPEDVINVLAPGGVYPGWKTPVRDVKKEESRAFPQETKHAGEGSSASRRMDGPPPPKMATFEGTDDWRPYFVQFTRISDRYAWSEEQRLDKLIECLRGKALKFFTCKSRAVQHDFKLLYSKMDERFGRRDMPQIIRRQLQDLRQNVDESLEDYAQRTQELASDGFPDCPENFIEIVAVDAFLKGCQDKGATLTATNRDPKTLDEALKLVKGAATNYKVIYGSRKAEVRRVSFDEEEEIEGTVKRLVGKATESAEYKRFEERMRRTEHDVQELENKLEVDVKEIKNKLGNVLDIVSRSRGRQQSPLASRSSSPTGSPARQPYGCFRCGDEGHFIRDCPNRERERLRSPSPRRLCSDQSSRFRDRSPSPRRDLNGQGPRK